MDNVPNVLLHIDVFCGLLLQPAKEQSVLDCLRENFPPDYNLKIRTPCGKEIIYALKDIPTENTPCPCGNPYHWLIKIERNYND